MKGESYNVGDKVACIASGALRFGEVTGTSEIIRTGSFARWGDHKSYILEVKWDLTPTDDSQYPPRHRTSRFAATSRNVRRL